jgi:predicted ATP-grasp superfamily ATP-dependent carboligase
LLFDRTIALSSATDLLRLPNLLDDEYIADIQVVEQLAAETYSAIEQLPPGQRSNRWDGRADLLDKVRASIAIREAGLLAPPHLSAAGLTASVAVETLGLPLVVKPRLGSNGDGVAIVTTSEELSDVLNSKENAALWIVERFIDGTAMTMTGLATAMGVQSLAILEKPESKGVDTRVGPAAVFYVAEFPSLVDAADRLFSGSRLLGLFDIDVIRDNESRLWIHDMNLRVGGTISAVEAAGIKLSRTYCEWLRNGRTTAVSIPITNVPTYRFPVGVQLLLKIGGKWTARLRTARWVF